MKLVMDYENEHFEIECDAAYVVILDPKDSESDMTLATMGKSSYYKIISAVARTLDSFICALAGDKEERRKKKEALEDVQGRI